MTAQHIDLERVLTVAKLERHAPPDRGCHLAGEGPGGTRPARGHRDEAFPRHADEGGRDPLLAEACLDAGCRDGSYVSNGRRAAEEDRP